MKHEKNKEKNKKKESRNLQTLVTEVAGDR